MRSPKRKPKLGRCERPLSTFGAFLVGPVFIEMLSLLYVRCALIPDSTISPSVRLRPGSSPTHHSSLTCFDVGLSF